MVDYVKYVDNRMEAVYKHLIDSDTEKAISTMEILREDLLRINGFEKNEKYEDAKNTFNKHLDDLIGDNLLGFVKIPFFEETLD